jgi:hypothetical protein
VIKILKAAYQAHHLVRISIFKKIGSLMKHAQIIWQRKKHAMTWLDAKIVSMERVAGHKAITLFIRFHNMEL